MGIADHSAGTGGERLVAGLLRGEAYDRPEWSIEHIETHISHVFLAGEYAYKIKKPLDLGFLDFSTLEKRRAACEEELRINCRLSPDLYLAVVPITGTPTAPRVEGEGDPIEYAVKMRRFEQSELLDKVFERGALTGKLIDPFAAQVARFHASIARAAPTSKHGSVQSIVGPAGQNFDQLAPLLSTEEHGLLEHLREWSAGQHRQLAPVFQARQRDGFVRECHGDLHLGNLVLIRGVIRIFDAIEFNDELRWIDVMSEVAFLLMDLRLRGRKDLAARFLNLYLESSGDYAGVRVLPYYIVYRALVRAKVAAMRAVQPGLRAEQAAAYRSKCTRHLTFAHGSTRQTQCVLVLLHGLSGSGKTTCSQILVEVLDAVRIRSDIERKRLHGMASTARSGSTVGAGIYREEISDRIYAHLLELSEQMLRAGQPVIVDATFLQLSRREQFRDLAQRLQVPLVIASFTAPEHALRSRILSRTRGGKDASEADIAVLEHQLQTQEPLGVAEQGYCVLFDTAVTSAADIRAKAGRIMEAARIPQA